MTFYAKGDALAIKDALVGKELTGYELSEDGSEISFMLKERAKITLRAYGDCCSSTWIEAIDDPESLRGRVLNVEEIEMPESVQRPTPLCPYPDVVAFYGLKVTTENGRAVIEYRNNSNGYYGGSLRLVD